jgi:hypothetical protein
MTPVRRPAANPLHDTHYKERAEVSWSRGLVRSMRTEVEERRETVTIATRRASRNTTSLPVEAIDVRVLVIVEREHDDEFE